MMHLMDGFDAKYDGFRTKDDGFHTKQCLILYQGGCAAAVYVCVDGIDGRNYRCGRRPVWYRCGVFYGTKSIIF